MENHRFEGLLSQRGITFFWNEHHKIWWLRKTHQDGTVLRSNPAGAVDQEEAKIAATKLIRRQFRNE